MKTFRVIALGCKAAQYESAQFAAALRRLGLSPASAGQQADLCLVHTCAVTAEAMRKSRQAVRAAARDNGTAVVAGCWAADDERSAGAIARVQWVIPNLDPAEAIRELTAWVRRQHGGDEGGASAGQAVGTTQAAGLGPSEDEGWISAKLPSAAGGHGQRPATSPTFNIQTPPGGVKPKFESGERTGAFAMCPPTNACSDPSPVAGEVPRLAGGA
ncbi:MAG: hypothetical protein PHU85_05295, partial [Phycisphaerae bacterium]|nr:hypothetical protein [Phycisphaerae bacterium]